MFSSANSFHTASSPVSFSARFSALLLWGGQSEFWNFELAKIKWNSCLLALWKVWFSIGLTHRRVHNFPYRFSHPALAFNCQNRIFVQLHSWEDVKKSTVSYITRRASAELHLVNPTANDTWLKGGYTIMSLSDHFEELKLKLIERPQ